MIEKHKSGFEVCAGTSMYPTIQSADMFTLVPYKAIDDIRPGDIVAFKHPQEPFDVMHRVIRKKGGRFITRGDNNCNEDPYTVMFSDIRGRVATVIRNGKSFSPVSGWKGIAVHKMMVWRRNAARFASCPARLISNILAEAGFLTFLGEYMKTEIIMTENSNGRMFVLSYRNKAIGTRRAWKNNGEWEIRFPYRLFIDEKSLPR